MQLVLILLAGFGAGFINALAGGGSFLTFPALIAAGLPAIVNAAWQFYLSGREEWTEMYPAIAGSPQRLMEVLSDLVLKTIEVYEIDQRQL